MLLISSGVLVKGPHTGLLIGPVLLRVLLYHFPSTAQAQVEACAEAAARASHGEVEHAERMQRREAERAQRAERETDLVRMRLAKQTEELGMQGKAAQEQV